jgi:hypothetical protein
MLKKITTILLSVSFLSSVAIADTTNIGVKLSYGTLEASGTETTNLNSTAVSSGSGDGSFPFGSVFVEREIELTNANIAFGLDYIPFEAEVDKLGGGDGTDATVNLKDHFTVYIQPSKKLDNGLSVFGKIGYSQADVKITDVTRQASTAGTASTDTGATKSLEGPMIGIGVEKEVAFGAVRVELTHQEYDDITYTNSNSKVLTAKNIELQSLNLSLVKKF